MGNFSLNLQDDSALKKVLETGEYDKELAEIALEIRRHYYGDAVYMRGLIEFSSYCRCNCYYCGLRRDNTGLERYRLTREEILACCQEGWELGFRTFVLQSGEDPQFTDAIMAEIVAAIHERFPDCAVTLSIGERSKESYRKFFQVGARRYLLRHEAASTELYAKLHPATMSCAHRRQCLFDLKELGYQVGAGFMVGAPFQTTENIIEDLRFMQTLKPDMIGIGPFIHQSSTPLATCANGSVELTLRLISIMRILFPYALIPATTALGTIRPGGRELGLKAGANVVMPNLSPVRVRGQYAIYDDKLFTGLEAAQGLEALRQSVAACGFRLVSDRGDVAKH